MKAFYCAFIATLHLFSTSAQTAGEIWGMTTNGGVTGGGLIYKTDADGSNLTVVHKFPNPTPGVVPVGSLTPGPGGKLYGVTSGGGSKGSGVLFEYDPATNVYKWLMDLAPGQPAEGKPVFATNGNLYGINHTGGLNHSGYLYELDPVNKTFINKYNFAANAFPSSLIKADDGLLYGVTKSGGANDLGSLFSYDPGTSIFTTKFDFASVTGSIPVGDLLKAASGKLYGIATTGGANGRGVIFEYDIDLNQYTPRFHLQTDSGSDPVGSLVERPDNVFHGVKGGFFFEYTLAGSTYTKKAHFPSFGAPAGFTKGGNDKIYWVDTFLQRLWEYDPALSIGGTKYGFDQSANGTAIPTVLVQANGKLYGTGGGGAALGGVIFEFNYTSGTYTKKLDFGMCPEGCELRGSLLQSASGRIYGTGLIGGSIGGGTLFELNPLSNEPIIRVNFNPTLGRLPEGELVEYNSLIYGLAQAGGTNDFGTIYTYNPATATASKIFDFGSTYDAKYPSHSLVVASGKFYGTTRQGGANDGGVLFEYDPVQKIYTKKYDFGIASVWEPGGIALASNGKLYGVANGGGSGGGFGVIFQYDLASSTYTKKVDLDYINGYGISMPMIEGPGGKLYGVTDAGGANNFGVLFEYDINSGAYVKKYEFNNTSGTYNSSSLLLAANGKLYGISQFGGANGLGTFFEFDLANNTFTKKTDFDGTNGAAPAFVKAIQLVQAAQTITFDALVTRTFGDAPFGLTATSSSGLPVSFQSSSPGVATIAGNTVTILSVGSTDITASQSGYGIFNAAPNVTRTLTVAAVTGLEADANQINVYPNPANGRFTLQLPAGAPEKRISILSIEGRLVEERISTASEEHFSTVEFPKGMYILKVAIGDGVKWLKLAILD